MILLFWVIDFVMLTLPFGSAPKLISDFEIITFSNIIDKHDSCGHAGTSFILTQNFVLIFNFIYSLYVCVKVSYFPILICFN